MCGDKQGDYKEVVCCIVNGGFELAQSCGLCVCYCNQKATTCGYIIYTLTLVCYS